MTSASPLSKILNNNNKTWLFDIQGLACITRIMKVSSGLVVFGRSFLSNPRSSNKRWVASINSVNAAGLRAQDSAFVGLSNFPSFDRNHRGQERNHLCFGFLQDRRTHHIDPQPLGKFEGGDPSETFQRTRDGCTRGAPDDRVVVENARDQGEGSPFVDERDRLLDQTDLAH